LGFDDMKKFCDQNNEIYIRLMVLIPDPQHQAAYATHI
jgi:hypothetical protein